MRRRKSLTLATGALAGSMALAGCGASGVSGGGYPQGAVTVVVPYSAGGPSDTIARAISECLSDELDQTFVAENQPGAAGTIGTSVMTQSKPDGQTLGLVSNSSAVAGPILQSDVDYETSDIQPLALLAQIPSVIAVSPDSKYKSIDELIEAAKTNPDSISVAVPGATTAFGIELDRWAAEYDLHFKRVPFEGGSQARTAVLGGSVDALWDAASQDLVDAIESGQYRALATGSEQPVDELGLPTLAESGFPELVYSDTLFSLAGPTGIPEDIQDTLETALETCSHNETFVNATGETYVPDEFVGSEDLGQRFDEIAKVLEEL